MDLSSVLGLRARRPWDATALATVPSLSTLPLLMVNLRYRRRTVQQRIGTVNSYRANEVSSWSDPFGAERQRARYGVEPVPVAGRTAGACGARRSIVATEMPRRETQVRTPRSAANFAERSTGWPSSTVPPARSTRETPTPRRVSTERTAVVRLRGRSR